MVTGKLGAGRAPRGAMKGISPKNASIMRKYKKPATKYRGAKKTKLYMR